MLKIPESELRGKIARIKEIWLDVDGVMTRQQDLAIYDISTPARVMFKRRDGVECVMLTPCDQHGVPVQDSVEYLAAIVGEPVFEGYRFDTRDGRMIETAVWAKLRVFFVSGRNSPAVLKRALNLGAIPLLGEKDKIFTIERESRCGWEEILFVGDGFQDVDTLERAGVSVCPADGDERAKAAAMWITNAKGGEGVVYEILDAVFSIRGIRPR